MIARTMYSGLVALAMAGSYAGLSQQAQPATQEVQASHLHALLTERRDVLATRAEVIAALVRLQKAGRMEWINAQDELLAAEFDLAQSSERRLEVLKSRVENLKAAEEHCAALKRQAQGTESEVLAARARRLEAEIQLERLREALETSPSE